MEQDPNLFWAELAFEALVAHSPNEAFVHRFKRSSVAELLSSLRHYCDAEGINFRATLMEANQRYKRHIEDARKAKRTGATGDQSPRHGGKT